MSVKRFNYALDSVWYANEAQYKADYLKSIVFIHKSNGDGVAIYAHGSYFPTDVSLSNFNELVDNVLSEGSNITITPTTDAQGKIIDLKIGAVSLSSLTGLKDADKTKLVEAQAVADALTTPFSLEAEIVEKTDKIDERVKYTTATFTQNFTNLKGETVLAVNSVLVEGDNVNFDTYKEKDGSVIGVEISADDTLYKMTSENYEFYVPGTEELVNGVGIDLHSGLNGEFDIKPGFSGDAGSITLIGDNKNITVERLEGNADIIKISADLDGLKEGLNYAGKENNPVVVDNTTREIYHAAAAVTRTEDGDTLSSENTSFTVPTYSFDEFGHVSAETTTTVTLPNSAFETYAVSAAADGSNVKVNLDKTLGATTTTDSISLAGEGDITVSVAGNAGAEVITIKDIPYVGKEAIAVSTTANTAGNKEVSLTIDSNDKFLSQSTSGLKADIEVAYDSTTNYLYLKGKTVDGTTLTTTGFDASAFVKDSFLDSAAFVTLTENEVEGKAAGEYLKLVFKTVDTDTKPETVNSTQTVYLPVSDLVKTGTMDFKGETTKEFTFDASAGKYVDGANLATALNKLDADLDATLAEGATKDTNEVVVVTGLTQTNGLITSVDSAVVVNKTYVDNAIKDLDSNIETTSNATNKVISDEAQGSNDQMFTKIVIVDGKLVATKCEAANVDNAKLVDYTTKSTEQYVGITAGDTIAQAFAKLEESWDWGIIE